MITDSPEFAPHWEALLFRDYLIEHPEVASEYERLKRRLAEAHRNDRAAYTAGKSEFIASVMQRCQERNGVTVQPVKNPGCTQNPFWKGVGRGLSGNRQMAKVSAKTGMPSVPRT